MARKRLVAKGIGAQGSMAPRKPFVMGPPPTGSYDPMLDAQEAASRRGLGDLEQDIGLANARDLTDYGQQTDRLGLERSRSLEDIGVQRTQLETAYGRNVADTNQDYGRATADLGTNRTRGQQDYDRNVALLSRKYTQLGGQQQQQQNKAGVLRGGAMLQAATKRQANQGLERQPLDTSWQRFVDDANTQQQRLTENRDTTLGRLGEDRTFGLGQLSTAETRVGQDADYQQAQLNLQLAPPDASNPFGGRNFQDRTTQLTRAQREQSAFGLDTASQRYFQAAQSGWIPPTDPRKKKK